MLVAQVLGVRVTAAQNLVGLETLAYREADGQLLVLGVADDEVLFVLRHHAGGELLCGDVVLLDCLGIIQLLGWGGHEGRPFAVEVDEVLRGWLSLAVVGGQELLRRAAVEDVAELPPDIEAILHGDVHALAGLGGVGMAGVAGEEDARVLIVVVEGIDEAVPHLVHGVPSDHLDVDEVGRVDLVSLLDDLLNRGGADLVVVILGHDAKVDVDAAEVTALTRDVQD